MVPLLGAIAVCHCSVLWWGEGTSVLWLGGRVTTNFAGVDNFGGVDVVPLLGAISGCHCSVLCLGGRVTTNFGSGCGAIAGCHCRVSL